VVVVHRHVLGESGHRDQEQELSETHRIGYGFIVRSVWSKLLSENRMAHATDAKVEWNSAKKQWQVVIQVGAEVIRRPCPKNTHDAADAELRTVAVQTARDEGYDLDDAQIAIVR
jgi:hypothetical protein